VSRADLLTAFLRSDESIAGEVREDVLVAALAIDPNDLEIGVKSPNGTRTCGSPRSCTTDVESLRTACWALKRHAVQGQNRKRVPAKAGPNWGSGAARSGSAPATGRS
jgi:hypothetical protein